MQRPGLFVGALGLLLTACVGVDSSFEALAADAVRPMPAPSASEAPRLVQEALDAELAGDLARRSELLALALAADPDYGPARWHSGQIKFDGAWRTPDAVAEAVNEDERWRGYRELRGVLGDAPPDHVQLAEYCREHRLADEERYHWANVLLAWPGHEMACDRLRLREFHGRLFTAEQIAELEQLAKSAEQDLARFKPRMTALCRDAISGDEARRTTALAELRKLADPAALAALESAVQRACARSPKFAPDLQSAMIAALANMPQHGATLRLLNHAVFSESPEIRQLAAESLRPRRQTDYVPLLMAALQAPIEVEVDVFAAPDGTVRMTETVLQAGPEADRKHVRSINYETEGALGYDRSRVNPGAVLGANLNRAAAAASDSQERADAANAEAEWRNQCIEDALKIATGKELGADPEAWWSDWQEYNELEYLSADAEYVTYEESTRQYYYPQAHVLYPREVPRNSSRFQPRREASGPVPRSRNGAPLSAARGPRWPNGAPRLYSCFVPGTLVWTRLGAIPIENVVVGDMVLTQHPTTGELGYRPVLQTTLGKPTLVLNINLGEETIGATPGHRFWINGRGWEMAKFLEPSAALHALGGVADVRLVEKGGEVACHNLVVDDFHSFFVGESKVLVHDNSCPRPALAGIPGSSTLRGKAQSLSPLAVRDPRGP